MRKSLSVIMLVLLSFSYGMKNAVAHPHAYIDLKSAIYFNEKNMVSGLKIFWRFDILYTSFVLNGVSKNEAGKYDPDFLHNLAEENLSNLAEYNYFTYPKSAGKPVKIKGVSSYETDVEAGRLWLSFDVEFETPVSPKDFQYAVYDPTYYIEILYEEPIIDFGSNRFAEENCSYEIQTPQPTEELLSQMAQLSREETAGDGVGQHFAEKVFLSCG